VQGKSHVLELGLTRRGVEDIGDVQSITLGKSQVLRGEELLTVLWEGHNINEADELYHTVWKTIEGVKTIKSPVTGFILETHLENQWVDEEVPLLSMMVSNKAVFETYPSMVDEESYERIISKFPPGRFAEFQEAASDPVSSVVLAIDFEDLKKHV
jgi:hypothetical protein